MTIIFLPWGPVALAGTGPVQRQSSTRQKSIVGKFLNTLLSFNTIIFLLEKIFLKAAKGMISFLPRVEGALNGRVGGFGMMVTKKRNSYPANDIGRGAAASVVAEAYQADTGMTCIDY